jgi:hypothetical protein
MVVVMANERDDDAGALGNSYAFWSWQLTSGFRSRDKPQQASWVK